MSDLWKQCEGETVDNQFPLLQFVANTNHSAVFLTKAAQAEPRQAAIKFISADIPEPGKQLEIWKQTAELNHPHLLRVFDSGRCRMAGMNLLYVVMEQADEELSKFLPQRALTAPETRDLLEPLVEVLEYVHGQGMAHGHIKPSNLCAIADQLKLSSDTIAPIGYARESHRDLDVYDAPENSATTLIAATCPADVWSLGITLVEALTQQAPALPFDDGAEVVINQGIPAPFYEVARNALVRAVAKRWTIKEIAAQMNPPQLAAAASASATISPVAATGVGPSIAPSLPQPVGRSAAAIGVAPKSAPASLSAALADLPATRMDAGTIISPLSVPISREPAVPFAKLPHGVGAPPRRGAKSQARSNDAITLPSYVIPLGVLGVLAVGVVLTLPGFFRRVMHPSGTASSGATTAAGSQNSVGQTGATAAKTGAKSTNESVGQPITTQNKSAENNTSSTTSPSAGAIGAPAPAAALNYPNTSKSAVVTRSSASSPERGEVVEQVLPEASAKALSTIHGTVRVGVRVQVDASGNVSTAELDSPSPSKYFAERALVAARQWQFASPVSEGHSLPSRWIIRFEFTRGGATANPTQILP
jgi:TonB family protein